MVHVSKLALSITLLLSFPCWAMDATKEKREDQNKSTREQWQEIFKNRYKELKEMTYEQFKNEFEDIKKEKSFLFHKDFYLTEVTKEHNIEPEKTSVKFIKIPTPKQITLISKEVAKDKIDTFKAMMSANPAIVVVKDLETLKNPDIKKIREVGNYTVFGNSLNQKWVVDNETGNDLAFSQEMIEKVMQLSTGDIEFMLKNDAFNEQSIDNILESMNQKQ